MNFDWNIGREIKGQLVSVLPNPISSLAFCHLAVTGIEMFYLKFCKRFLLIL